MAKQTQTTKPQQPNTRKVDGVQVLPTPTIGDIVHYSARDQNLEDVVAAMVTKVEAPGQVQLRVYSPGRVPYYKSGVSWAGDDKRMAPGRPCRANGCWQFIKPVKDPMQHHRDALIAKAEARKQLEEARLAEAARIANEHEEARNQTASA